AYVREKQVPLELCLTSNWLTQAVPGEMKNHPIRKLMENGIRVTINTDDPGIFNCDLNGEYKLLQELFDFSEAEFKKCNETAAAASFIPQSKKKQCWPA